jgi:hypothetical protein
MEILGYIISGIVSVFTVVIILSLQSWINKKRVFKAFYSEIESNLNSAQRILPLAEQFTKRKYTDKSITHFDLQCLHTYSYEEFKQAGYLLLLNKETRELLEETYTLISSHNYQTEKVKGREIDFSSFQAMELSILPRFGGYAERLKKLIEKLKLLKEKVGRYI